MVFSKVDLDFDAFHLWYKPTTGDHNERRARGFQLAWKVETLWPDLELEVGGGEGAVESPGWGEVWRESWGEVEHHYRASLLLTQQIVEEVGEEGRLVVELEVNAGEGVVVLGKGEDRKWVKSYDDYKTWYQARESCLASGGP